MRVAVCEAGYLTPTQDAGARAVADLLAALTELGHDARFFTELGRDILADVTEFDPDIIIVSRPGLFMRVQPLFASLRAPIVYLAHDLHFVRVSLQGGVDAAIAPAASAVMKFVEAQCFARADLSLVPTSEEAEAVAVYFPGARCIAIDYFAMPEQPLPADIPGEYRVIFVGGSAHAPNSDGVAWFVREVWPEVMETRPGAQLLVCGTWDEASIDRAKGSGVSFAGPTTDAELDALLAGARVAIAPLRFGAGMKRKTLHYLSHGLPVVGTDFAVEGLRGLEGHTPGVLRANSATEWVRAFDAIDDPITWRQLSRGGSDFVRERFSAERYTQGIERVIGLLG